MGDQDIPEWGTLANAPCGPAAVDSLAAVVRWQAELRTRQAPAMEELALAATTAAALGYAADALDDPDMWQEYEAARARAEEMAGTVPEWPGRCRWCGGGLTPEGLARLTYPPRHMGRLLQAACSGDDCPRMTVWQFLPPGCQDPLPRSGRPSGLPPRRGSPVYTRA
jgi:hypothetical protein